MKEIEITYTTVEELDQALIGSSRIRSDAVNLAESAESIHEFAILDGPTSTGNGESESSLCHAQR